MAITPCYRSVRGVFAISRVRYASRSRIGDSCEVVAVGHHHYDTTLIVERADDGLDTDRRCRDFLRDHRRQPRHGSCNQRRVRSLRSCVYVERTIVENSYPIGLTNAKRIYSEDGIA